MPPRSGRAMALAIGCYLLGIHAADAETLAQALASAYADNPTLNAQRSSLRATDEGVPQALSGYRPTVGAAASAGATDSNGTTFYPRGVSLTVTQPLFAGFRTLNGAKIAEAAVLAGREVLRTTEQTTLLAAAQAFMDLVEAQATLNLQKQNVDFLSQQVKTAQDKLDVGTATRTDLAMTNASLAAGQASVDSAVAALNTAIAVYEQVIGHRPRALGSAKPIESLLSKSLNAALDDAMNYHPAILAASYNVDVADFNVKVEEGALLPTVSLQGSVSNNEGSGSAGGNAASAVVSLNVPIYSGGALSSKVRQAKETLDQARIQLDVARDQVRQQAISEWGVLDAARAQISAADSEVNAQNLVLSGVVEQQQVGQATTLDVLTAQQTLLSARVALVTAQHNRVVASYTLLADIGRLDAETLGLSVTMYDPVEHYAQVRDKWDGLRTPDGR
jgi:outer membrane protein